MLTALLVLAQIPTATSQTRSGTTSETGSGSALPPDARLDRPLALEARIEPLPEVLARLGKTAGAALTVERRMQALKATVLVAERPVRRTMADLASVFDAEWIPVEGGYRLEMPAAKRNLLDRYLDAERKSRRAATERRWREAAEIARYDWARLPAMRDEAMRAVGEFKSSLDPGFAEAHARYQGFDGVLRNGHQYLLGRLLARFGDSEWTSLWEGRAYYASSVARAGIPKLPDDSPSIVSPWAHREPGAPVAAVRAFFRIDPDADEAAYVVTWDGGGFRANPGTGWGGYDEALAKHPFRLAQDAWATDRGASRAPELDRPLRTAEPRPSPWEGPWANDSDALEWLHRQSGLDVVAEATRRASRRGPGPFSERTVREALAEWRYADGVRLESGALLYRPHAFWGRRAAEPPEAAMRRWEARPDRGIDALAELVGSLTPAQAKMLGAMNSRKRLEGTDAGLSGLRIWGALDAARRRRLVAGESVPLAELDARARKAVLDALFDGVFEGASLSPRMLALFDGPWEPAALGDLALWATTEGVRTGSLHTDAPGGGADPLAKIEPVDGISLEIAAARGEGIAFVLPRG